MIRLVPTMRIPLVFAGLLGLSMGLDNTTLQTRILDEYAVGSVKEDGILMTDWNAIFEFSESF